MDIAPYVPIIVEATKFVFTEVSRWIEHVRELSGKPESKPPETIPAENYRVLTYQEFQDLAADPATVVGEINIQAIETNAYVIRGLVEQIQIHRRNLMDLERIQAEYGALTPPHVKRAIEREATEIVEKAERLKRLLEQVYGRKMENV